MRGVRGGKGGGVGCECIRGDGMQGCMCGLHGAGGLVCPLQTARAYPLTRKRKNPPPVPDQIFPNTHNEESIIGRRGGGRRSLPELLRWRLRRSWTWCCTGAYRWRRALTVTAIAMCGHGGRGHREQAMADVEGAGCGVQRGMEQVQLLWQSPWKPSCVRRRRF